jgi:hypothetical protein
MMGIERTTPPEKGSVPQAESDLNHPFSELVSVVEPGRYAVPTQNNMAHHLPSPCQ